MATSANGNANVLSTTEDHQSLLMDIRKSLDTNMHRQRELKDSKQELLTEARSLADDDYHGNRERIETIRGVRARRNEPLFNDDGSPILNDDNEQVYSREYFKDNNDQFVMKREGLVTGIIHELSGKDGKTGLYQEFGALREMEEALLKEINKRQNKRLGARMKGLEALQARFAQAGLPEDTDEVSDDIHILELDTETEDSK